MACQIETLTLTLKAKRQSVITKISIYRETKRTKLKLTEKRTGCSEPSTYVIITLNSIHVLLGSADVYIEISFRNLFLIVRAIIGYSCVRVPCFLEYICDIFPLLGLLDRLPSSIAHCDQVSLPHAIWTVFVISAHVLLSTLSLYLSNLSSTTSMLH